MEAVKQESKDRKPLRRALGRGLGALITSAEPVPVQEAKQQGGLSSGVSYVPLEQISAGKFQPRQNFNEDEITELSESIKAMGVLQPILLRKVADQEYEIVAGERRFRAAQRAGLLQVPVLIKEITDRECLEIGLVENIQRSNLSAVEEAKAYQKLIDEFGLGQKEIAERVGKSRAAIANYLRILSLPQELLQQVEDGTLSVGHAKAILSIKEPSAQLSLARKALRENLSVRALEELISRVVVLDVGKSPEPRLKGIASSEKKISFPEIEEKLRRELGTKVSIRHHRTGKGKIEVSYFSEEELARIVERLC